jgi:tRNA-2-methylthio-N6-dimethylallyladenosine synthase
VPYVRGRERSRLPEDILREARSLADRGCRETTLLGQNVNSYGKGLDTPCTFPELLRRVHETEGIRRIRMMTSHPKDLSDDLIRCFAELPKVCHHLHLPVQAGSDRVLREMNRHYTAAQYLALVDRLRAAVPDLSLTTDLIVGFPGETEEDFRQTLELVKAVRYDTAFSFRYSPREGTPAAKRTDQVDEAVKKDRLARLNEVLEAISAEDRQRFLDATVEVMAEGPATRDPSQWRGRTSGNQMVHFPAPEGIRPGDLLNVKIDTVKAHTLSGIVV